MPYGLKPTPSTWQSSKRTLTGRLVTLRFPCQHDVSMMSATDSNRQHQQQLSDQRSRVLDLAWDNAALPVAISSRIG